MKDFNMTGMFFPVISMSAKARYGWSYEGPEIILPLKGKSFLESEIMGFFSGVRATQTMSTSQTADVHRENLN